MADEAQPLPDGALPRVAPLDGKRAPAMAIVTPGRLGLTLLCHWDLDWQTGRHARCWSVCFASAVPLLNQVNNILLSRSVICRKTRARTQSLVALSAGRRTVFAGR